MGGRKCGAFLSSIDRDPHPTCARFRGKICTKDMTCDFCVGQWELFAKKRTYKERKRSSPSGSVPPARGALPHTGTSSEVPQPGTSSSAFSRPSGGQDKRGGVSGCTWCCVPGGFLHSCSASVEREGGGGGVSLDIRLLRASVSSAPSGAREGEVARSQRTPPARAASSVASPHSSQHAWRHDELREVSEDHSIARSSRASRSLDRGARKDRGARSRDRGRRDLRIATALGVCALVLGETGLNPLIDTALDVTGRGFLTATDQVDSVHVPQLVVELAVT